MRDQGSVCAVAPRRLRIAYPGSVWRAGVRLRSGLGGNSAPVAPMAHQVILEPGRGQFRDFKFPRAHTRIYSYGFFLVHILTCGKRESVS